MVESLKDNRAALFCSSQKLGLLDYTVSTPLFLVAQSGNGYNNCVLNFGGLVCRLLFYVYIFSLNSREQFITSTELCLCLDMCILEFKCRRVEL